MRVYWKERDLGEISIEQCRAGRDLLVPFALFGSYYLHNRPSCQGVAGVITLAALPSLSWLASSSENEADLLLDQVIGAAVTFIGLSLIFLPFQWGRGFVDGVGRFILWGGATFLFGAGFDLDLAPSEGCSVAFSFFLLPFLLSVRQLAQAQSSVWKLARLFQTAACCALVPVPLVGASTLWQARSDLGYKRVVTTLLLLSSSSILFGLYNYFGDSPSALLSYAVLGRIGLWWSQIDREARVLPRVSMGLELVAAVVAGAMAFVDPRPGYLEVVPLCLLLPLYTVASWKIDS